MFKDLEKQKNNHIFNANKNTKKWILKTYQKNN